MVNLIKLVLAIFIFVTVISSCNNNICNEQTSSKLNIYFSSRKTKIDTTAPCMIVYGLNSAKPNDSIYKNFSRSIGFISLPLSGLDTLSAFYFSIDTVHKTTDTIQIVRNSISKDTVIQVYTYFPVREDTLYATYKASDIFVSYECGFRTEFSLHSLYFKSNHASDLTVTNKLHEISIYNTADSIVISQPQVSIYNEHNCKIYFSPGFNK